MTDPRRVAAVTDRLARAGCVAADEEAAFFVAQAPDPDTLDRWVARREQGEPPAWITGIAEFAGLKLRIEPGVYVPRIQTETLARKAGRLVPPAGWAADLCTGAGAVAAFMLASRPGATVIGVDIDPVAAGCAKANGVPTVVADVGCGMRAARFDVITSVAPYVPTAAMRLLPADVQRFEPARALDGGPDGLDLVRRVTAEAARLLRAGGWLVLELGGDQDSVLVPQLEALGFDDFASWRDEDGDLRGMVCRATGGSC